MLHKVLILCISVSLSFYFSASVYGRYLDGDLNTDCAVNWEDLGLLSSAWLSADCNDSLDEDCDVDFGDYAVLAKNWLQSLPQFNGMTYHVTNLQDFNSFEPSIPGSLRYCIAQAAADGVPSRIVFDVNGTIYAHASIVIDSTNPYLTICGTTAPGNGITIDFGASAYPHTQGYSGILIGTWNCRLCNLHITQTKRNTDGVQIQGSNNIVERCTMTWCRDEGISVMYGRGNVVAFCRVEYCGSQPGDGSGGSDGRGMSVFYGGSAIVVGNYFGDNLRGVLCGGYATNNFADFRNNRVAYNHQTYGMNVQGNTNAGLMSYANFISNTIENNTGYGIRYMDGSTFYRGNPNTNIFINDDENFSGTYTEVFTPITFADTPYPSWLIGAATPANAGSVGMGSGRCQCNYCE